MEDLSHEHVSNQNRHFITPNVTFVDRYQIIQISSVKCEVHEQPVSFLATSMSIDKNVETD